MAMDDQLIMLPESKVAATAHVTTRRVRHWDAMSIVSPTVVRAIGPRTIVRLYGWQESVELLLVADFIERGVPITQVSRVLVRLRDLGHDQPLRQVQFATAGNELYFRFDDGGWEGGRAPGQGVIHEVIDLELIHARVREAATPSRIGRVGQVERRRGVLGSRPVFAGTRIPLATVQRYIAAGFDDERILRSFPDLDPEDVRSVRAAS